MPQKRICADGDIDKMLSEFSRKNAEERAFILIRNYFDVVERMWNEGEEMSDEFAGSFLSWFYDPHNVRAKESAMNRMIEISEINLN